MGNEISVLQSTDMQGFRNYELKVKTGQIFNALRDNNRNSLKVAGFLSVIKENNLFMDDFDSYETYAQSVFGLKKAQAYNLANVGKLFVARDEKGRVLGESVLPHTKDADWSTTKLLAFIQAGISPSDAQRMIDSEVISMDMSVSKLKAAIKDWKSLLEAPDDMEEDEPEDESGDMENSEPEGEQNAAPTVDNKREYVAMVKEAMDKNNELFERAKGAMIITGKTYAQWKAAHNIANTAFDIMNDLYFGQNPRFFNYSAVLESIKTISNLAYLHGVSDTGKATAGIDEAQRREQLKCWQSAIDSITSGLNSFLTLYSEETRLD